MRPLAFILLLVCCAPVEAQYRAARTLGRSGLPVKMTPLPKREVKQEEPPRKPPHPRRTSRPVILSLTYQADQDAAAAERLRNLEAARQRSAAKLAAQQAAQERAYQDWHARYIADAQARAAAWAAQQQAALIYEASRPRDNTSGTLDAIMLWALMGDDCRHECPVIILEGDRKDYLRHWYGW